MKLIDYTPNVLAALRGGEMKQTELTEAVFGLSGRGNSHLIGSLFPHCVRRGWVTVQQRGRSKVFTLTPAGAAAIGDGDPHANWNFTYHNFNQAS